MITPASHVAAMTAYALADLEAPPGKRLLSLSQNESLRPPSPRAIDAATRALTATELYPDPDWRILRHALAELHDIPAEGVLCGNGSMDLIAGIAAAFANEENAVLAPAHAYPFFRTAATRARARFDTAPELDGCVSVEALLSAVRPDTRVVFVANPGNPTGTRISRADLIRLRDALRGDVLLVIDEAYGEFTDHLDAPVFDLFKRGDTVILRSFSKAYGLAGLRVGWGLFPAKVARDIRKVTNPNNISCAGQAAAAAAVADQSYMRQTCDMTSTLRDRMIGRLRQAGFDVPASFTNFALLRLPDTETARRIDAALRADGVFLRPQGSAGLPHCLRITIAEADRLDIATVLLEGLAERTLK